MRMIRALPTLTTPPFRSTFLSFLFSTRLRTVAGGCNRLGHTTIRTVFIVVIEVSLFKLLRVRYSCCCGGFRLFANTDGRSSHLLNAIYATRSANVARRTISQLSANIIIVQLHFVLWITPARKHTLILDYQWRISRCFFAHPEVHKLVAATTTDGMLKA